MVFEICCRRDEFTYSQERDSGLTQQVPLKRFGKPEEIVKIALFLALRNPVISMERLSSQMGE